jgi:hypothetical protein|tara:strand:+ start:266 stop:451 length:186 start_codon:yes stop_codon:yes gene_type:complete
MKKLIEIVAGLILLLVPLYAWITNLWGVGDAALNLLKGGILWILILLGVILLVLGISELKN